MPFSKVAKTSQLDEGWVIEVNVKGRPYAICKVRGEIHALSGECSCTGGPLGSGRIQDGLLVCPWHGWRYDVHTGVMEYDGSISVPTYPVMQIGEWICIDATNAIA
jgi:nitrite reductase/ring-hydroxylating ferredoxin subunit